MTSKLSLFLSLCVISGTLFFLFANAPEARTLSFDDGRLIVTALMSEDAWLEASVDGEVYTLRSSFIPTQPAKLTLKVDAPTDRLAYFDETFGMWRPVETIHDPATSELLISTTELNTRWRAISAELVARPNLETETAALIAVPPVGAVGYTLEIAYTDLSGESVLMEGLGQSGGCAGEYRYTGETTPTSSEITFSDALRYQIMVVWQIGEGCMGREVIE